MSNQLYGGTRPNNWVEFVQLVLGDGHKAFPNFSWFSKPTSSHTFVRICDRVPGPEPFASRDLKVGPNTSNTDDYNGFGNLGFWLC